ncbi:MAG: hypothetical protein LBK06_04385 [Planctomycetaceae bacterium]|jgi:hypothetical protein|nr:hypothetical protein [Planctomycetaceae bacterium]
MIDLVGFPIENDYEYLVSSHVDRNIIDQLIDELKMSQFFAVGSEQNTKEIIARVKKSHEIFIDETNRITFLDAEEIAEENCVSELKLLFDLLPLKQYFDLHFSATYIETKYTFKIGEYTYTLWDYKEPLFRQESWKLAMSRFIRAINIFLTYMNDPNNIIYDYSGNDTTCLILSKDMIQILEKYRTISKKY